MLALSDTKLWEEIIPIIEPIISEMLNSPMVPDRVKEQVGKQFPVQKRQEFSSIDCDIPKEIIFQILSKNNNVIFFAQHQLISFFLNVVRSLEYNFTRRHLELTSCIVSKIFG